MPYQLSAMSSFLSFPPSIFFPVSPSFLCFLLLFCRAPFPSQLLIFPASQLPSLSPLPCAVRRGPCAVPIPPSFFLPCALCRGPCAVPIPPSQPLSLCPLSSVFFNLTPETRNLKPAKALPPAPSANEGFPDAIRH
jgi:hypothetical protein